MIISPFVVLAGVVLLAATLGICISKKWSTRLLVAGTLAVVFIPISVIGMAHYPWLLDARARTYRDLYESIHVGMTRAQVLAHVQAVYGRSENSKRLPPKVMQDTPQILGFFMDAEGHEQPNCEGIFLSMKDGIVASKYYSVD